MIASVHSNGALAEIGQRALGRSALRILPPELAALCLWALLGLFLP